MKRIAGAAIAVCFLVGANAGAQNNAAAQSPEKSHTETTIKHTGPGPNSKMKMETVVGTVKEYEAGKKITISGPGDKTYSFDLDDKNEVAKVEGSIVVGQMAKVSYHKADDGTEHVAVISHASARSQAAADAPKMHVETTEKHTGAGPNTKMKTEVVVGTVKTYEAGKKITVTGPKDKDYSFDLDDANTAVQGGNLAVGQRVKVTFTKTDGGDKITSVAPYKK
ncbi:MAG: hypothetical protein ABI968_08035 [Acidobacteriota bacterium]